VLDGLKPGLLRVTANFASALNDVNAAQAMRRNGSSLNKGGQFSGHHLVNIATSLETSKRDFATISPSVAS
jgi:hypothetical protein